MDPKQLIVELEDVIRTAPDMSDHWHLTNQDWLGRARAVLESPIIGSKIEAQMTVGKIAGDLTFGNARAELLVLLQTARHRLRMEYVGPVSIAVDAGMVFDYFDHLRRILEEARSEILIVDPYLSADFVAKYLPFVSRSVVVRLLGREKITQLGPAVAVYNQQHGTQHEVRSGSKFHDRYLFIDGLRGFLSGASFDAGGGKTPTVLLELTDTAPQLLTTYNQLWARST